MVMYSLLVFFPATHPMLFIVDICGEDTLDKLDDALSLLYRIGIIVFLSSGFIQIAEIY